MVAHTGQAQWIFLVPRRRRREIAVGTSGKTGVLASPGQMHLADCCRGIALRAQMRGEGRRLGP